MFIAKMLMLKYSEENWQIIPFQSSMISANLTGKLSVQWSKRWSYIFWNALLAQTLNSRSMSCTKTLILSSHTGKNRLFKDEASGHQCIGISLSWAAFTIHSKELPGRIIKWSCLLWKTQRNSFLPFWQ